MKASQAEKSVQSRILLPILNKLALVLVPICAVMVSLPGIVVAQESELAGIEEIIVTAQRREQNLQDVPISISAFTAQVIEKNMFSDVAEYLTRTPNASYVSNGARSRRQISIRGVTNFLGFVGSGTTGFYVDDFSIAGSTINPPIMDVERIEILRGPQSTYFGRNALGGGISITSKKPTDEFHGSIMADYSSFSTIDVEGVVNIPMGDTLAMRVNGKVVDSDGNIKNVNAIGGGNFSKYEYVKASMRWIPTQRLTVDVTFQYAKENVGMREGVPSGVFSPFGHLLFGIGHQFPDYTGDGVADPTIDGIGFWPENDNRTNYNFPQKVGTNFRNGVVRIDYQGEDLLFTSITGYINSDFFLNGDIDGGSGDWFNEFRNIERESVSTEFRVQNTNDSAWRWSVGGLYAEDTGDTVNTTFVGNEPIPGFGAPCCFIIDSEVASFETDYWALFGQVDYDINDKLTLSLGGRYSEEKKQDDTEGFSGALVTILSVEGKFTDFSPRFALTYEASDTLTYYGTISKGYKSGGVQIAPVADKETFEPEELWNYEIGFKTELIENRLRMNVALFYMDWTNLQVSFQENLQDEDGNFILFGGVDNADSATSKGAELELTALVSDNLLVNFNVGYLNAKFDDFVALIEGENHRLDGSTIPNSPKWTMSADAEYGFKFSDAWDGYARLEWVYRDNINPNTRSLIFTGFPWDVPSYNYFNLRIGAESKNLTLVAYVENLFDKTYYVNAYQKAFAGGMFIEPSFQRIGLRATYKFGN
jgi:iron complex outermembrane receptor protein